jgi:hypothetical protein
MRTNHALFVVWALSGCGGLSEEKYQEKVIDKSCDLYLNCEFENEQVAKFYAFDDKDECVALFEAYLPLMESETCEFDSEIANECLAALNDFTCEDIDAGKNPDCDNPYSGECESEFEDE